MCCVGLGAPRGALVRYQRRVELGLVLRQPRAILHERERKRKPQRRFEGMHAAIAQQAPTPLACPAPIRERAYESELREWQATVEVRAAS